MNRDDTRPGDDGHGAPPVGERIRRRRDELGIPAKDLAERVGISPSYLSLIERQGRIPSPEVAEALAQELGDDVELYVVWARSKGVKDLGTYARRLDRLVRWSTDPETRRRIDSGEEFDDEPDDAHEDDDVVALERYPRDDAVRSTLRELSPRAGLGSIRSRMARFRRARGVKSDLDTDLAASPPPGEPDLLRLAFEAHEGGDPVRVPVLPNGADPADDPEPLEVLDLDARLLPPDATGLFAYRPDVRASRRVRDLIRPGDLVILGSRPGPLRRRGVHAVRHEGRVVLTRAVVKGGTLAMLPGQGDPSSIDWIPLRDPEAGSISEALARVIAGSVVATVRWWGGNRYPRDYDRRAKPR